MEQVEVEKVTRKRTATCVFTLRCSRKLRERLERQLQEDGRSLAEYTRSLWHRAVDEKKVQPSTNAS